MFDFEEILPLRSEDYILRLVAEEAAELSQACLKYIRAKEGFTPKSIEECTDNLIEETADVYLCLTLLEDKLNLASSKLAEKYTEKAFRLRDRWKTNVYKN